MPAPIPTTRRMYRVASWVTAALAFVAAVLTFGFGLAAVVGPAPPDDDQVTTGTAPAPAPQDGEVLAADQAEVTGTITTVVGTQVEAPPLPLPLTLTVARGGGTKAEFSGGAVGGKNATISWDGGRPLPIRGQGSLDFNGPVDVNVTPAGASWSLDGGSRLLTPGSYSFGATVAVSMVNVEFGTPRDGARLEVPQGAAASVSTEGGVKVATSPAPLRLRGPGRLMVEGSFDVRTRDGVRPARKVTFGPGAFRLDLEPQPGGYRVDRALLQGPFTVDG